MLIFFKQIKPEFSYLLRLSVIAVVFIFIIDTVSDISRSLLSDYSEFEQMAEYIKISLKILGISLITQCVSDICKDSGENALSSLSEIIGKTVITVLVLPIVKTLVELSVSLLK